MKELPDISSSNYCSNEYDGFGVASGNLTDPDRAEISRRLRVAQNQASSPFHPDYYMNNGNGLIHAQAQGQSQGNLQSLAEYARHQSLLKKETPMSFRIVKVFIVDPDSRIPLKNRVLYSGDEQTTEATDQELFFEVPITKLLADHNEHRIGTVDKEATKKGGEDVYLEPIRIRDLKMVVTTIASF